MANTKTYYGLKLQLPNDSLSPLTRNALGRIVERNGRPVSYLELVDGVFGIEPASRRPVVRQRVLVMKKELDSLCELNPTLIESGQLGPVGSHGYRLTVRESKTEN